jgi:tripartite-type tricarboxylate transporter receptor subunit TctC
MRKRRFLSQGLKGITMAAAVASGWSALPAHAEPYPNQTIRMVVPFPPGGLTDAIARLIAQALGERLGQSVVVDNRAGASGNIGTALFTRTRPDGYTLLLGSSTPNAANPNLYKQLGFDPHKDFAPIGMIASAPNVLLVSSNSPYKTVGDLLAAAKASPGKLTFGSAGSASSGHLAGATMARVYGLNMLHVPYKGAGPALTDLMGGQITMMLDPSALPQIRGGQLRPLAVPSPKRLPALPDVPTFAEATGNKDMIASAWYGLMAPAGTPPAIIKRLHAELAKVLQDPAIRTKLIDYGADVGSGSPEDFGRFMESEITRYAEIIRFSGAKVE